MSSPDERGISPDASGHSEKRVALGELRENYDEASRLGSTNEHHSNLAWILGHRRDPNQNPLDFETKRIELVALWLQDLAAELDRRVPKPLPAALDDDALSAHEARRSAAQRLREATEKFLDAYRGRDRRGRTHRATASGEE